MGTMKTPRNRISEEAAIDLLRRLFSDSNVDELSLEDIYAAAGRSNINPETNRNWLNGVLAKLKDHKFVATVNKFENSRSKLDKVKLTSAGKAAIGRNSTVEHTEDAHPKDDVTSNDSLSLDEMLTIVEDLRVKHPKWEIVFEVKAKSSSPETSERNL